MQLLVQDSLRTEDTSTPWTLCSVFCPSDSFYHLLSISSFVGFVIQTFPPRLSLHFFYYYLTTAFVLNWSWRHLSLLSLLQVRHLDLKYVTAVHYFSFLIPQEVVWTVRVKHRAAHHPSLLPPSLPAPLSSQRPNLPCCHGRRGCRSGWCDGRTCRPHGDGGAGKMRVGRLGCFLCAKPFRFAFPPGLPSILPAAAARRKLHDAHLRLNIVLWHRIQPQSEFEQPEETQLRWCERGRESAAAGRSVDAGSRGSAYK